MKKIISFILIFTIIFSFSITSKAEVVRNETVYVNLDYDGSSKGIKVVTHISGDSKDELYTDYGSLEDIKLLTEGVEPVKDKDSLKWDAKFLKDKDIYYEGEINKKLPIDLKIEYFLDGTNIDGSELAGKSGILEIRIKIKDSEDLTTQIQVPLNLDIFTGIEFENGVSSVVGKTMTIVFTHLPMGDGSFLIKAKGKNIELNPILISSTGASMFLGEDIGKDISKLTDGIKEMSDATKTLEDGSRELNKGMKLLKDGLKSLGFGISKFFSGLKEISNNFKILIEGFSKFNIGLGTLNENIPDLIKGAGSLNDGINKLYLESKNIENGIDELNNGVKDLSGGLGSLSNGLEELNTGHSNLTQLAQSLINSDDPRVKALAEGVINEAKSIEELSNGAEKSKIGADIIGENSEKLLYGYKEYNNGFNSISLGFNALNNEIINLPKDIDNMVLGHTQLLEGLKSLNEGYNNLVNAGNEVNINTNKIPEEINKIIEGQEKLTIGLLKLNEEGFEKIEEGIEKLSILDSLKEDKSYTSFVDGRNKENSTCQFIMQTPSIKMEAEKVKVEINIENNKTFIQRFLDLFTKFTTVKKP